MNGVGGYYAKLGCQFGIDAPARSYAPCGWISRQLEITCGTEPVGGSWPPPAHSARPLHRANSKGCAAAPPNRRTLSCHECGLVSRRCSRRRVDGRTRARPRIPQGARRISSKVVFWSVIWWQFGQLRLFNPTIEAFFPAWQERMPPGLALALRERNASGGQGYGSGS